MLDSANAVVALIGGVVAVALALLGGWFKWGKPKAQRAEAMSEALLGRAAVHDRSGAIIQPAQPGMPARVAELADAVRELVNMQHRVDDVEAAHKNLAARVDEHDVVLAEIRQARVEHVVSRAESAQAFAAIEAVAKAQPED